MWGSLGGISGQDIFMRQFFKAIGVDVLKTQPVMFKGASLLVVAVAGKRTEDACDGVKFVLERNAGWWR
jgi:tripartite-type tricarboxylate transporter receptor subunit TctC